MSATSPRLLQVTLWTRNLHAASSWSFKLPSCECASHHRSRIRVIRHASPATEVRTVVCARPRWMHASCQWQRLSKAAAEGGVSKLSSETAEKRQKTFTRMPPWFRLGTVVHRENLRVHRSGSIRIGCFGFCAEQSFVRTVVHRSRSIRIGCFGFCGTDAKQQEEWSKVMLAHKPAAVRRSERLVAALAPPSVPARLVRCAGHC